VRSRAWLAGSGGCGSGGAGGCAVGGCAAVAAAGGGSGGQRWVLAGVAAVGPTYLHALLAQHEPFRVLHNVATGWGDAGF
jgi:hypothetical protein